MNYNEFIQKRAENIARKAATKAKKIFASIVARIAGALTSISINGKVTTQNASIFIGQFGETELAGLLEQEGYIEMQEEVARDYSQAIVDSQPFYVAQYGELVDFAGINQRAIELSLDGDAIEFQRIGQKYATELRDMLTTMTIAPITVRQATILMSSVSDAPVKQIRSQVNTGLAHLHRRLHADTASQIPDALFYYDGPSDSRNRGFCHHLVGKVLTREQLSRLNNQSGLSVLTGGGGWNCRHYVLPVSAVFAKQNALPFAEDSDIRAANKAAK